DDAELEYEVTDDVVTSVTVTLQEGYNDENVTPLRCFPQLKELNIVRGANSLDLSPIRIAPLETLTCNRMIVLRNLSILRDMPTLKTINGEPSTEYLDSVEAEPVASAGGM
ncbi:MAG: hypothetical protein KDA90_23270, partial [Planctomycetaceae bacterium]|nr:hypothetical protein [Planctomycetaceae bacterium]